MSSYLTASDEELVASSAKDPEAFAELFRRHSRAVYAYCARRSADLDLAEDLTSVVFLEAFRRCRNLQLSNTSALPWLLGVAHNVARNTQRSLRRYRAALDRVPPPSDRASAEDDAMANASAQQALASAIEALRPLRQAERDVVLLVLWSELSYADAAFTLGIPIGTVRSRLSSARQKLAAFAANPAFSKEY